MFDTDINRKYQLQADFPQLAFFMESNAGYDLRGLSWGETLFTLVEEINDFQFESLFDEAATLLSLDPTEAEQDLGALAPRRTVSRQDCREVLSALETMIEVEQDLVA